MQHLVLVRHGESEINAIDRTTRTYCGQIETPLTDFGRKQAIDAAIRLAQFDFIQLRRAISSPLTRAQETLQLMLGVLSGPIELLPASPALMERSHGLFEGRRQDDVFQEYPHYRDDPNYSRFMSHFEQHAPGGENLTMVTERAWAAVQELTSQGSGDLIVVSHFNPIRCILGQALALTSEQTLRLHIPNAEPIVLGWNGRFELVEAPDLYISE